MSERPTPSGHHCSCTKSPDCRLVTRQSPQNITETTGCRPVTRQSPQNITETTGCRPVTRQSPQNITETALENWTDWIHRAGGKSPTQGRGRQETPDCQRRICGTDGDKPKSGDSIVATYSAQPMSSLLSQCKRLEEENASMLRQIMGIEDQAMKSATQQLQQYDRAGTNIRAVQMWTDRQIQEAQQDLELTRERREEHVTGLRLKLQNCEQRIQETQKDLQLLQDYRDRGHSADTLQAAELQRRLRVIGELQQDQAADVEALAQIEMGKLLESHQKLKAAVLQDVVEQHVESLPLSVKRMCLQNQEMRSQIKAYQEMISALQDDIKKLLEDGDSLCKSFKEETDRLCSELLLNEPSCPPDEDVVLDIPLAQPMRI